MKKLIPYLIVLLLVPLGVQAQVAIPTLYSTSSTIEAGDLIQAQGSSAVYYLASNSKRYVFPNEKTYNTWYPDFAEVKVISLEQLQTYSIGGNVTYRAGTRLVKITTDPKTYAVEPGGILRWITSESVAKGLYGDNWAQRIDDVPDPFFVNYKVSTDNVDTLDYPLGSLVSYSGSVDVYLIESEDGTKVKRRVINLSDNRFRSDFIISSTSAGVDYPAASEVASREDSLVDPTRQAVTVAPTPEPEPEPEPLPDLAANRIFVDMRAGTNGDGTFSSPFNSLTSGAASLVPGMTMYLRGNETGLVYTEALPVIGSGGSGSEKTVQAYPGEKVILALSSTLGMDEDYWILKDLILDNQDSSHTAVEVSGRYNKFDNVELMNGTGDGIKVLAATANTVITGSKLHDLRDCVLIMPGADNVTVSNSTLYNCSSDAVEVYAESGTAFVNLANSVTILGNDIYTNISSENGVNLKGVIGAIISINQFHGFSGGPAIKLSNLVNSVTVSDNEIYGNAKGIEITVAVNTPRAVDIYNNLIYDITGDYALRFDGVEAGLRVIHNTLVNITGSPFKIENLGISSGQIRNNLISNAGTNVIEPGSQKAVVSNNGWFDGAAAGALAGADNIEGENAIFADVANDVYSLLPSSPAVDAGIELGYISTDFNGNPREVGADPDLGAFELQ